MKKLWSILFLLLPLATLGSCGGSNTLKAPEVSVDGITASWDAVDNAVKYEMQINDSYIFTQDTSYTPSSYGTYTFAVRALADNETNMMDSDWSKQVSIKYEQTVTDGVVVLNQTVLNLAVDDTFQLEPTKYPTSYEVVTYSSSNTSVATVSNSGLITVIGVGNAKITAKANGYKDAICNVYVDTKISGNATETLQIEEGDSYALILDVNPKLGENDLFYYSSTDSTCAYIGNTGVITGMKKGECDVEVTTSAGGYYKIHVIVSEVLPAYITFEVTVPYLYDSTSQIYLVGNFNNWKTCDTNYVFTQDATNPNKWTLLVETFTPKTDLSYKYIMSTENGYCWESYAGSPTANRTYSIKSGAHTCTDEVTYWQSPIA